MVAVAKVGSRRQPRDAKSCPVRGPTAAVELAELLHGFGAVSTHMLPNDRRMAPPASPVALLRLQGLQALSAVLKPDLDRARRHVEGLRERLALVEVGQRLLLEGFDQHLQLLPRDLAPLGPALTTRAMRRGVAAVRELRSQRRGDLGGSRRPGVGRGCRCTRWCAAPTAPHLRRQRPLDHHTREECESDFRCDRVMEGVRILNKTFMILFVFSIWTPPGCDVMKERFQYS